MKNRCIFIIFLVFFILMTITPGILIPATISGIKLWGLKVVPGLIMGMIFIEVLNYYMPDLSSNAVFFIIISSILCGFPAGALNCMKYTQKVKDNNLLEDIMPYCNISSPGFIINYIYYNFLYGYMNITLYILCVYAPVVILVILEYTHGLIHIKNNKRINKQRNVQLEKSKNKTVNIGLFTVLNNSIDKMLLSVFKLGGYIIIFSCLCAYIRHITYHFPAICMIFCGILEITNGIYLVSGMSNHIIKIFAILLINAFGGISTLLQTAAVIKDNIGYTININKYIFKKIKLILCTALILCILVMTGQI